MPERFTVRWLLFVTFLVAALLTAALVVLPWILFSIVLVVAWSGLALWLYLLIRDRT